MNDIEIVELMCRKKAALPGEIYYEKVFLRNLDQAKMPRDHVGSFSIELVMPRAEKPDILTVTRDISREMTAS